jgi:hypothetical protein
MKAMRNPILRLVRIRNHFLVNMLCFWIIARISAAIVNVHMSPHGFAHQIAQHRGAIVVRREFSPFQLNASTIWPIDGPPRA